MDITGSSSSLHARGTSIPGETRGLLITARRRQAQRKVWLSGMMAAREESIFCLKFPLQEMDMDTTGFLPLLFEPNSTATCALSDLPMTVALASDFRHADAAAAFTFGESSSAAMVRGNVSQFDEEIKGAVLMAARVVSAAHQFGSAVLLVPQELLPVFNLEGQVKVTTAAAAGTNITNRGSPSSARNVWCSPGALVNNFLDDQYPAFSISRADASTCMWKKKNIIGSGSALPRWLRKFKLGGSSSSSLLPVVAPSQGKPALWESHSPGRRGFAAAALRPSSQRRSSAAAESTSNSVSEILQGGSASGSFTPPPSLTSASSSPSRDTATRTPSPTTGENAAADATGSGGEPPVGTRRSGSPPGPTDPPATAASSVATTTVNDDAMKVLIAMIAANITINMALVVNMKGITGSWETQWEVLYVIFMMFSVLSTVTSIFTAVSPAESRARRFSSVCVRLGLLVATALLFVYMTCQLGHSGCIAGAPTAAVAVIFLAVVWWKYC